MLQSKVNLETAYVMLHSKVNLETAYVKTKMNHNANGYFPYTT